MGFAPASTVATNTFYRRQHATGLWHFCSNCTDWPVADFTENKSDHPPCADLCAQCVHKKRQGTCEQPTGSNATAPLRRKKILIIDDHSDVRRVLTLTLRHLNYETCEAADASAGIKMSLAEDPDLILMDLFLPDSTGLETARKIKKNSKTSHIPIIGCSGLKNDEIVAQAVKAGIVEFLAKPISPEQLAELIEKLT